MTTGMRDASSPAPLEQQITDAQQRLGLASAVRWYTEGFAQRSGMRVDLTIAPGLGRLPQDVETALFRIVQEGLTNAHRHSGSPTVAIQIVYDASTITLEVTDAGRGLPRATSASDGETETQMGVGIRGMQERMRQLGGNLSLIARHPGLTVRATLPLRPRSGAGGQASHLAG